MKQKLFQVDAFTHRPFSGNPAGVMVSDVDLPEDYMQQIAMEMNLSETAFVVPANDHFRIRYFTPAQEVALCGHATLASAHILYETGIIKSEQNILFKSVKVGELPVHREGNLLVMNFPEYVNQPIPVNRAFKSLVGFEPVKMYASSYNWIIAVAAKEKEITAAHPQPGDLTAAGLGHLMITSLSETNGIDFVLRCFAPSLGIDEDPVTGSAHCALTPLWSAELGNRQLVSKQLSARGGELKSQYRDGRVVIKGEAVTVFEIHLKPLASSYPLA